MARKLSGLLYLNGTRQRLSGVAGSPHAGAVLFGNARHNNAIEIDIENVSFSAENLSLKAWFCTYGFYQRLIPSWELGLFIRLARRPIILRPSSIWLGLRQQDLRCSFGNLLRFSALIRRHDVAQGSRSGFEVAETALSVLARGLVSTSSLEQIETSEAAKPPCWE